MPQVNWVLTVQKFCVYGCLGLLIEVFFTGLWSLFQRHWKMTGSTYLPMFFVYGFTALVLEAVSGSLFWPFWCKAPVYVCIIYGAEALSGLSIMWITGRLEKYLGGHGGGVVPWTYAKSKWTLFGLVEPRYLPVWLALALAFDPISHFLTKILRVAATVLGA